jgi:transposase
MELPGKLRSEVGPLLAAMMHLNEQLAYSDAVIERLAARDDVVQRLSTAPRIGPITAAAFRATVDDALRFKDAHQFEAYVGLVPSEMSSGEKQRRGRITRTGDCRLRWLLVQAAHRIRYDKSVGTAALRQWAKRIEARRGRGVATVALARKLAGILFAIMRDGTTFEPAWTSRQPTSEAA